MPPIASDKRPPASILVVDDVPDNLTLLKHILHQEGYEVRVAPSGRLALRSIQAQHPDLVLLDIRMPDMDGFAVCRELKIDEQTRNIPIIFLTGMASMEDEEQGLNLGAVDYFNKPLSPHLVRARVRHHIQCTQQRHLLEQWGQLDCLTALPNKTRFERTLEQEWYRGLRHLQPLSIALLDIDGFKRYNEAQGYPMGDQALRAIAVQISVHLKRSGDLVARYQGATFVLLMPDTDAAAAYVLAECARLEIVGLNLCDRDMRTPLTASLGGATCIPYVPPCTNTLLHKAHEALNRAKMQGRNCVVWEVAKY